jgi:hypothetical protein
VTYSKGFKRWNTFYIGHRLTKYDKTNPPLCACGCGQYVKWSLDNPTWNKYIDKHRQLKGGWKHTEDAKLKIKESNLKTKNIQGAKEKHIKIWTEDKKTQRSIQQKEIWNDPIYYSKMKISRQNNKNIPGYIEKQKAKRHTDEWKINNSKRTKAMWTKEYKQKYSETHSAELNPNWKGGLSFLPYPVKWNQTLKNKIKEQDNYTCQNPNCEKQNYPLSVHHIDYNKENCEPDNLITLCMICNAKANGKRDYWRELYTKILYDTRNNTTKLSIA